ncbi:regulatory protein RecX [Kordiimonas sp. SCSIO 12610]|uniref:regulatory protein RecX n=1 Tax=Kordiimonas sp. SCSIO 12610 TaxID=2829597 RepID=UPI00210B39A8|nr:RecX family transcriptional regulator [Kordiimonas sp. SCSIO 12610]UTW56622.1 RecX family transcriptional regulator [Kordiimonas sp. SCSIO 12610]
MKEQQTKKVTAGYIERAALHYLGRFSSSEANLREVLKRKVRRRNQRANGDVEPTAEQLSWIDEVVEKCKRYDYVNDLRYALERAKSLLRKGKPLRLIKQDLFYKGVKTDDVNSILAQLSSEREEGGGSISVDLIAAVSFVKRRRFGAFRRPMSKEDVDAKIQKELASMARGGFSYELSQKVLNMEEEDIREILA